MTFSDLYLLTVCKKCILEIEIGISLGSQKDYKKCNAIKKKNNLYKRYLACKTKHAEERYKCYKNKLTNVKVC